MKYRYFPKPLSGSHIHLVGAKGTGVCALAEILVADGAIVTGSDVTDIFYTDAILAGIGVPVSGFSAGNIHKTIDIVIHSAAYRADSHPELLHAAALGIPVMTYPEALGALSRTMVSVGICGVHGKTTTTAITGLLAAAAGLPIVALTGSAVSSFGDRATYRTGDRYFIAETCEYRRHFLNFSPSIIVLTSIEMDHQDYYPDCASIVLAFREYLDSLPEGGVLVYCADDPEAARLAKAFLADRRDIRSVPYGFSANGRYHLSAYLVQDGQASFRLDESAVPFTLRIPGRHIALDAAAAIATCRILLEKEGREGDSNASDSMHAALASFRGSRRRAEVIGEAAGILFMDDYAHHPTAIMVTLAGLREFHPRRRMVVDFMSHTYSRTIALFDEFAQAFGNADIVVLHRIYPSARESPEEVSITGRTLADAVAMHGREVLYFDEPMSALDHLSGLLKAGDLFVTLGAGDNWRLSHELHKHFISPGGF